MMETTNVNLLLEEIYEYEKECAVRQAVLDERKRVRKEEKAKKAYRLERTKYILLGTGLAACGIASFFVEFDLTGAIFLPLMGLAVALYRPEPER